MSLMAVGVLSTFGIALRKIIQDKKPKRIIETGTYLGRGTTTVIASAIKDFNIDIVRFYSLEVNPHHYKAAFDHLKNKGLLGVVSLINGLSIHRYELPNRDKIKRDFLDREWPEGVYIDHSKDSRVDRYFEETNFDHVPDGMLLTCLEGLNFSPDLVLLDSGGHIGEIEFNTVIPKLKKPCVIALDDVFHVKHYNNLQKIRKDSRFKVLHLSKEKFGFCITKFTPEI
jgi:hypothetical protein